LRPRGERISTPAGKAGRFNCSVAVKPHLPSLHPGWMKAAVELMAEATDVIGSQSRQEVAVIKHNRYAFA
jgi:hypothetical protein